MTENLKNNNENTVQPNDKGSRVATDVASLYDQINGIGETPSAEQWKAFKDGVTALNASLQEDKQDGPAGQP